MIKDPEILEAVVSVLEGNPSEDQQRIVDKWLLEDKNNQLFFDGLADPSYRQHIDQEALESKERIYLNIQGKIKPQQLKRKFNIWKPVAAAAIVIIVALVGVNSLQKNTSATIAQIQTKASNGSLSKITLGDGTIVELNAGSELYYPASFNSDKRIVSLKGEAYFEVAKDADHPFIVETNNIKIEVLGTHFNVKSYEGEEDVTTTLLEGSVRVVKSTDDKATNQEIILKPNQQLVFSKTDLSMKVRDVDADLYTLWKDNQYYFDKEKFADIVQELQRRFGVNITIESPELGNLLFSAIFTENESLKQILNTFKKHRNFDYKETDNGIIIFKK